jgi:4-hydroxy-tetrahydrodipicolinate synthase
VTQSQRLGGIWAAVLTPVDAGLQPDAGRAGAYYRDLLGTGCDGINLLGTTGEAMSFSAGQRARFMQAVAQSGLPCDRIMAGTGAAALDDAAALTQTAFDAGFRAALIMPPFFLREASDDGIVAFFDALFSRLRAPRRGVLLYNFPRMSGITFHPALVDRLIDAFPEVIAGVKDSSNDRQLQEEILKRHPDLSVFPGAEDYLPVAKAYGAAGCISGSVCLWPRRAHDVFYGGDEAQARALGKDRASLAGFPLVPAVRYLTARARSDDSWERAMPPQVRLTAEEKSELDAIARGRLLPLS